MKKTKATKATKRPHGPVSRIDDTFDMSSFARAVSAKYRSDALAAGLVVACLHDGTFYASVARYPNADKKKLIVCSARGDSLVDAVEKLANEWRKQNVALNTFERACAAPSGLWGGDA